MISYAQNFEDVILRRVLKDVVNGFYIDIGAQHPVLDSVSLAFHEMSWQGVHVEPIPTYADMLRKARPGDNILNIAVSTNRTSLPFFSMTGTGLSTGREDLAAHYGEAGFQIEEITVPSKTLSEILDDFQDREIHWMKIDCEGMEADVIASWTPSSVRPWVVVVESIHPGTQQPNFSEWEGGLIDRGYTFAYEDGLNRFYVSEQHAELLPAFSLPPNCFDNFQLSPFNQGFRVLDTEIAKASQRLGSLKASLASEEAVRWAAIDQFLDRLQTSLGQIDRMEQAQLLSNDRLSEAGARLAAIEEKLTAESDKRRLAETMLSDSELRLRQIDEERIENKVLKESLEQSLSRLEGKLRASERELNVMRSDATWRLLDPWRRLKKKVARTRRKLAGRSRNFSARKSFLPNHRGDQITTNEFAVSNSLVIRRSSAIEEMISGV